MGDDQIQLRRRLFQRDARSEPCLYVESPRAPAHGIEEDRARVAVLAPGNLEVDLHGRGPRRHCDEISIHAACGETLALEPSSAPVGYVINPNRGFRALIYGDQGTLEIDDNGTGKTRMSM